MQEVPFNIHYIWEGENIPEEGMLNILTQKELSPLYDINIWTTRPISITNTLEKMCHSENDPIARYLSRKHGPSIIINSTAKLYDELCQEHPDGNFLKQIFYREMNGTYRNLAAASDITRFVVIYLLGGVYMDVDVTTEPLIKLEVKDDTFAIPDLLGEWKASNAVIAAGSRCKDAYECLNIIATNYVNSDRSRAYTKHPIPSRDLCVKYCPQPKRPTWKSKRYDNKRFQVWGRISGTVYFSGPGIIFQPEKHKQGIFPVEKLYSREYLYVASQDGRIRSLSKNDILLYGRKKGLNGNGNSWVKFKHKRRSSF